MDQDDTLLYTSPHSSPEKTPLQTYKEPRWTWILCLAGIATTFGASIPVGYNIGVVNTPIDVFKAWCNASVATSYGWHMNKAQLDILWSAIVSVFLIGGMIGSLMGSWLADTMGRKGAVIISGLLGIASAAMFVLSKPLTSVGLLFVARFVIGLSSGLITGIVPMYLLELAPASLKGAMGVLCPLGLTLGVLIGQFMGLSWVLGTPDTWHYLLAFYGALILVCALALPFIPESPKYLNCVVGSRQRALRELSRLRGCSPEDVAHELDDHLPTVTMEAWSVGRLLKSRELRLNLALVCALQAGQQFSGINAVFYYSMDIFRSAGLSKERSQYASLGAGLINFVMAVFMIPIVNVCRRRTLAITSCSLCVVTLLMLTVAITFMNAVSWMPYFSIVSVLLYVLVYGIGLGPIPYFIGSELFDVGPRPSAMALGSVANWSGNFFVGMTFPTLQTLIGQYSFLIFATTTALLTAFVKLRLPETNARTETQQQPLTKSSKMLAV